MRGDTMDFLDRSLDSEERLLSLIGECSSKGSLNGRKKLMKLVFFMEYLELDEDRLSTDINWSNFDFIIYSYGPFSHDVMDEFDKLKEEGLIKESRNFMGYEIELTEDGKDKYESVKDELPKEDNKRLEVLSNRFSGENGGSLERKSLDYLGITKDEKSNFMGSPVEVIISEGPA